MEKAHRQLHNEEVKQIEKDIQPISQAVHQTRDVLHHANRRAEKRYFEADKKADEIYNRKRYLLKDANSRGSLQTDVHVPHRPSKIPRTAEQDSIGTRDLRRYVDPFHIEDNSDISDIDEEKDDIRTRRGKLENQIKRDNKRAFKKIFHEIYDPLQEEASRMEDESNAVEAKVKDFRANADLWEQGATRHIDQLKMMEEDLQVTERRLKDKQKELQRFNDSMQGIQFNRLNTRLQKNPAAGDLTHKLAQTKAYKQAEKNRDRIVAGIQKEMDHAKAVADERRKTMVSLRTMHQVLKGQEQYIEGMAGTQVI